MGGSSADYEAKPSLKIELKPRAHLSPERIIFLNGQSPMEKFTSEKDRNSVDKRPNAETGLQLELPELELLASKKQGMEKNARKIKSSSQIQTDNHQTRLFHSQVVPTSIANSEKKRAPEGSKSQLIRIDHRKDRCEDQKFKSFNEDAKPVKPNTFNLSSSFKQISERVKNTGSPVKVSSSNSFEKLKVQTKMDFYRSQKNFVKSDQLIDIKVIKPILKTPVCTTIPTISNYPGSQRNSANDDFKLAVDKFKLGNCNMFKRSFESDTNKLSFSKRKISTDVKLKVSPIQTGVPSPEKPSDRNVG